MFQYHLGRGTILTRSPIYHNTGHGPLTAHCIDGSSTVGQYGSTVRVFDMWTEEWALVSLSNADLRHHASHGVNVTRAVCHTFSAVHRWHRRAGCWQSQGSWEKGKEQERHLEAGQLCLLSPPWPQLIPLSHMWPICSPHCYAIVTFVFAFICHLSRYRYCCLAILRYWWLLASPNQEWTDKGFDSSMMRVAANRKIVSILWIGHLYLAKVVTKITTKTLVTKSE